MAEHAHSHGAIDSSLLTSEKAIAAVRWSMLGLLLTALLQLLIVAFSGSMGLLADAIHNLGDATTAIPLWIAFKLAQRPATTRFTYGYGRVEDLAGLGIVLTMLISA